MRLLQTLLMGNVMALEPIMLLWIVIMRLQGLIPVIVSLRSKEWEWEEVVRFHTPGWEKRGRG